MHLPVTNWFLIGGGVGSDARDCVQWNQMYEVEYWEFVFPTIFSGYPRMFLHHHPAQDWGRLTVASGLLAVACSLLRRRRPTSDIAFVAFAGETDGPSYNQQGWPTPHLLLDVAVGSCLCSNRSSLFWIISFFSSPVFPPFSFVPLLPSFPL